MNFHSRLIHYHWRNRTIGTAFTKASNVHYLEFMQKQNAYLIKKANKGGSYTS